MGQVFEYTSSQGPIQMPANAVHVQAYVVGGAAPGVNGNGAGGGRGGGGGAFCCFDIDTTPNSIYSVEIGGPGQPTRFTHVRDNQLTTGQSVVTAGGATGKTGAPASSCTKSGYGSDVGVLSNIHKGGDGADNQGDDGGGGGGGARVVADGGNGLGSYGSGLGGGNGGMMDQDSEGTAGSANTGGGGGGGRKNGPAGQGASGKIRLTITTTNP